VKRFFGVSLTVLAVVSMALSIMAFTASAAPAAGNGPDCTKHPDNPNCVTPDPTDDPPGEDCKNEPDDSTGDCHGSPTQPPGDPNPNPNGCEHGEPECNTPEPTELPTEEPTPVPTEEPTAEPTEEQPEVVKVDVCHVPPGNPANAHIINVSVHSVNDANGLNGHGNHGLDSWEGFTYDGVNYPGQGDFPGPCGEQPPEPTPTRPPTEPPCDPAACPTPEVTPTPTREREEPPSPPQTGGGWEAFGLAMAALSFASGAGGISILRRRSGK